MCIAVSLTKLRGSSNELPLSEMPQKQRTHSCRGVRTSHTVDLSCTICKRFCRTKGKGDLGLFCCTAKLRSCVYLHRRSSRCRGFSSSRRVDVHPDQRVEAVGDLDKVVNEFSEGVTSSPDLVEETHTGQVEWEMKVVKHGLVLRDTSSLYEEKSGSTPSKCMPNYTKNSGSDIKSLQSGGKVIVEDSSDQLDAEVHSYKIINICGFQAVALRSVANIDLDVAKFVYALPIGQRTNYFFYVISKFVEQHSKIFSFNVKPSVLQSFSHAYIRSKTIKGVECEQLVMTIPLGISPCSVNAT